MEKNNDNINTSEYITESFNLACENIDIKTINESNKKLSDIIKKYNIKPSDFIPQEKLDLFENCNYVLSKKKKLTNLMEMKNSFDNVVSYVKNNINNLNENKKSNLSLIDEFNTKYGNKLNESEKLFVKEMISSKTAKKETLFNNLKNECLKQLDKMKLDAKTDNDKLGLNELEEQIKSKMFNESTLIKDVAKLLELNVVLGS